MGIGNRSEKRIEKKTHKNWNKLLGALYWLFLVSIIRFFFFFCASVGSLAAAVAAVDIYLFIGNRRLLNLYIMCIVEIDSILIALGAEWITDWKITMAKYAWAATMINHISDKLTNFLTLDDDGDDFAEAATLFATSICIFYIKIGFSRRPWNEKPKKVIRKMLGSTGGIYRCICVNLCYFRNAHATTWQ